MIKIAKNTSLIGLKDVPKVYGIIESNFENDKFNLFATSALGKLI